ncbi:MucR family transcriptional regulator [Sphingomonas sp. JC676]|uniref:MucR family transcriptional regulator n=1 Tax=Sphingomonas sp. JC676 TaxID=2768065 RepID=UPI001657C85A|nr:MucR family transcriptional regulator [Sphingomonas sp. JC676]MBC9033786.1 MucR family transcriptional regulator [Sphingomonas sp. JC676]
MADETASDLLALTADIVSSHVANNNVALGDLPALIANVHAALAGLGAPVAEVPGPEQKPAVSIRSSVRPDAITCLEDGKKFKTLKRHLSTDHGMTPAEYRAKWNLPADYPMVAPAYAETRSALAKAIGLGRRPGQRRPAPKPI